MHHGRQDATGLSETFGRLPTLASSMTGEATSERDSEVGREETPPRSIAVLPFTDRSRGEGQGHLGAGIAENVLKDLSRIGGLHVASRASCLVFEGQALDVREVGAKLGVDAVVHGSVEKVNGRFSISAELVDLRYGERLWSQRYDREQPDIFAVQAEIARAVAEALRIPFSDQQLSATSSAATRSVEAYDHYLRGRRSFFRASRKGISSALDMFNRAIQEDPSYALAYAGLADCYSFRFMYFDPDASNLKFARNASEHALVLDHELAEAHAARGLALSLSKRYEEAEAEFEKAIRGDPWLFEAYYFYARTCFTQGKYEDACRLYEKASRVDPDDAQALTLLGFTYRTMGEDLRADEAARRALQRLERRLELDPDDARAMYLAADALVQTGKREQAIEWAEKAASLDPEDSYTVYGLACIYSRVGDVEKAVTTLGRAVACGFGHVEWIINDSDFDPLRDHPRFQALLETLRAT